MKKQFALKLNESVITATVRTCIAIPLKNLSAPKDTPGYRGWNYKSALHVDWKEISETGIKTSESVYFYWCMPETEEDLREMLTAEPGESNEAVLMTVSYPRTLVIELQNWEETNWGDFPCENPYSFPESYVQLKGKESLEIPTYAKLCSGNCGECVNTKGNCWELKKGEAVYFHQH